MLSFEKDERAECASLSKPICPQGCAPERQGVFFRLMEQCIEKNNRTVDTTARAETQ